MALCMSPLGGLLPSGDSTEDGPQRGKKRSFSDSPAKTARCRDFPGLRSDLIDPTIGALTAGSPSAPATLPATFGVSKR